jgi:hypothetical protein
MSRKIVIQNCSRCPYISHSGAFTKGGSWPVCHGDDIIDWGELNKTLDYNDPEAGIKWSPPILPTNDKREGTDVIPNWCPLESNQ